VGRQLFRASWGCCLGWFSEGHVHCLGWVSVVRRDPVCCPNWVGVVLDDVHWLGWVSIALDDVRWLSWVRVAFGGCALPGLG
jgi:hypothetical protein